MSGQEDGDKLLFLVTDKREEKVRFICLDYIALTVTIPFV